MSGPMIKVNGSADDFVEAKIGSVCKDDDTGIKFQIESFGGANNGWLDCSDGVVRPIDHCSALKSPEDK